MDDTAIALIEIGVVFFGLGVLGHVASKISLSPIPLYLLGGLALGEGGLIEFAGVADFGHIASEIGVVLLLLMLGLEYSAKELVTGLRKSWLAGIVDLVLNMTPGILVALLLGWGAAGALVMAGVTYISSSGIVA
ncbi:MAG: cation:proton antiporter, partial [Glaciihabitans sp.]